MKKKLFRELSLGEQDQTRLYWMLVLDGPSTMRELRMQTNWTTHRTNEALYRLKQDGCVRLIERGQHYQRHVVGPGANRCGKWEAIARGRHAAAV